MLFDNVERIRFNLMKLLGSGIGFAKPGIISGSENGSGIEMYIMQLNLPDYHNVFFNRKSNEKMVYHIAGYGQSAYESLVRATGETVERYSSMASSFLFENDVIKSTYNTIIKQGHNVLPIEFLNIVPENNSFYKHLLPDEEVDFIKLINYKDGKDLFIPFQMVIGKNDSKKYAYPVMSTGTATHLSYEKAMCNAMTESFQIHSFMSAWYLCKLLPRLNWKESVSSEFMSLFNKTFGKADNLDIIVLVNNYEGTDFNNYITVIHNKEMKFPVYAVGMQGGLVKEYSLWRSMMEAAAIYVNLQGFYIFQNDKIDNVDYKACKSAMDLDSPFYFWANENDINLKNDFMNKFISSDFVDFSEVKGYNHLTTEEEMQKLIDIAQKSLSYYSFLDITSPELTDFGYKTVRFVAPELLAMHFPGCPYLNHPYFKNKGVCVKDVFPHPLP